MKDYFVSVKSRVVCEVGRGGGATANQWPSIGQSALLPPGSVSVVDSQVLHPALFKALSSPYN